MNVKVGDLVMLIHAKNEENIGTLGTVLSYVGTHTYPLTGATVENTWEVQYFKPLRIAGINKQTGEHYLGEALTCVTPDPYLMPLRGEEVGQTDCALKENPLLAEID